MDPTRTAQEALRQVELVWGVNDLPLALWVDSSNDLAHNPLGVCSVRAGRMMGQTPEVATSIPDNLCHACSWSTVLTRRSGTPYQNSAKVLIHHEMLTAWLEADDGETTEAVKAYRSALSLDTSEDQQYQKRFFACLRERWDALEPKFLSSVREQVFHDLVMFEARWGSELEEFEMLREQLFVRSTSEMRIVELAHELRPDLHDWAIFLKMYQKSARLLVMPRLLVVHLEEEYGTGKDRMVREHHLNTLDDDQVRAVGVLLEDGMTLREAIETVILLDHKS